MLWVLIYNQQFIWHYITNAQEKTNYLALGGGELLEEDAVKNATISAKEYHTIAIAVPPVKITINLKDGYIADKANLLSFNVGSLGDETAGVNA